MLASCMSTLLHEHPSFILVCRLMRLVLRPHTMHIPALRLLILPTSPLIFLERQYYEHAHMIFGYIGYIHALVGKTWFVGARVL